MTIRWKKWGWFLGQVSCLALGGAIAEAVLQPFSSSVNCALAQITPDNTLPNNSRVTTQDNIRIIEGGTQAGSNLFHSFEQFSVPTGSEAYFNNTLDIQNIISRITGKSISNIDGLIRANGTANLFLINPNGFIFGPNASLNIGGSFLASTASSLKFADGIFFSATAPQTPSLLTISVPIGLQYGENPSGNILNQSQALNSRGEPVGLQVESGKTLALVGGDVRLDGGRLTASEGQIELGGLTEAGTVGLEIKGNNFSLNFPGNSLLSNVSLADDARVWVRGSGQGNITVNANNFSAINGGALAAGTQGLGDAGSITVNTNDFNISGIGPSGFGSGLYNETYSSGNGGNIFVNTKTFNASSGAGVFSDSLTDSSGDAGNIFINASTINVSSNAQISSFTDSLGKAGDITIETGKLTIQDGAEVGSGTFSKGRGGNINVTASESLELIDFSATIGRSKLYTETTGVNGGNAGNLTIQTRQLLVQDGPQVSTTTFGDGQGGNLNVTASDSVKLIGTSAVAPANSGLFTDSQRAGSAGNLTIQTGQLIVRDGARVSSSSLGRGAGGNLRVNASESVELSSISGGQLSGLFTDSQGETGDAGDLQIETQRLTIRDGAQIQAGTFGEGQGGNLRVNASKSIELSNTSSEGRASGLLNETFGIGSAGDSTIITEQLTVRGNAVVSNSTRDGGGNAGNLIIQVKQLGIYDGGQVSAGTFGDGQGGKLEVFASESVELSGISADGGRLASGLYSQTQGAGTAGDLTLQTGQLTIKDGARVSTGTSGTGAAGDLTIQTGRLAIRDGAQVGTGTFDGSKGSGGNLSVSASESVELSGVSTTGETSGLFSQTEGIGAAGNLTIQTRQLAVRDGARVSASTLSEGKGGNLSVSALEFVKISSSPDTRFRSGLFTATSGTGASGDLAITTGQLSVRGRSEVFVGSEGTGKAGNLDVSARSILLDNRGAISARTASGNGGNITLRDFDLLLMRRNSQISATAGTARGGGDGGNININAPNGFIVAVANENSDITANAYTGSGGGVQINAFGIYGTQFRERENPQTSDITASSEFGTNGTVEFNTPDLDPNGGLVNLPTVPVDTEVAQGCTAGGTVAKSQFTIAGRDGLPPNPGEALNTDAVQVDLVTLKPEIDKSSTPIISTNPDSPIPTRVVEATAWVIDAKGNVILTANLPNVKPHSSWQRTAECSALN